MKSSIQDKMLEAMVEAIQISTATMNSAEQSYVSLGDWLQLYIRRVL